MSELRIEADVDYVSVRSFARKAARDYIKVAEESNLFMGRVLDYGCGHQPFHELLGKDVCLYDPGMEPSFVEHPMPVGTFDAVLLTYVLGYIYDPYDILLPCFKKLRVGGHLVGCYSIAWPDIEPQYLAAPTPGGINCAFDRIRGFKLIDHKVTCSLVVGGFNLSLGAGFIARRIV